LLKAVWLNGLLVTRSLTLPLLKPLSTLHRQLKGHPQLGKLTNGKWEKQRKGSLKSDFDCTNTKERNI